MDEEGIGMILGRAAELRSKITNCIHTASKGETEDNNPLSRSPLEFGGAEEEGAAESLLNIRHALESLEAQLSSLQALQQQQWYEREAALAEIDYSRRKLLEKLKEYKGDDDLEVIHEATAFVSETVEDNNDLVLPPYATRPSRFFSSDNGSNSRFSSTRKFAQNGATSGDPTNELDNLHHLKRNLVQSESRNSFKGVRLFINAATKTLLTLVGVISVLSLAGIETKLRKGDTKFKIGIFQLEGTRDKRAVVQCPPGKVLVVENGENRCLVKERVEIPFQPVVATPDVNYGCG